MIADAALLRARLYLEVYHQAILSNDERRAKAGALQYESLVEDLNDGSFFGSYANDMSPGCLLKNQLAAPIGTVPMWGQQGEFIIVLPGIKARVQCDSTPRLGRTAPAISLYALEPFEPFVSETGFRSIMVDPWGLSVDAAVRLELERLTVEARCMIDTEYHHKIAVPSWATEQVAEIDTAPVITSDGQLAFF